MNISKYFTWHEASVSDTAQQRGIDNSIPAHFVDNAVFTFSQMDIIREHLGHPIFVSSCYRSPMLNKVIGGSTNSDHMNALAVDFACPGFGNHKQVCEAIREMAQLGMIRFDQLIYENAGRIGWVHIGFGKGQRMQVLTYYSDKRPQYKFGILTREEFDAA